MGRAKKQAAAARGGPAAPDADAAQAGSAAGAAGPAAAAAAKAGKAPGKFATNALLERAQALVEQCEYETAAKFCRRAVDQEPTNVDALEMLATISLELGDPEKADDLLCRCIELSRDQGYTKYLALAQLREGLDAIKVYEKAVEILIRDASLSVAGTEERSTLCRQLSSTFCAMTEIYLTDCCYEEDAEQRCEKYLADAARWDDKNPEVYQSLASVRLSQQRPEDAAQLMQQNLALWMPQRPEGMDEDEELEFDTSTMPPFDFRVNSVKLLLEVGLYERALDVIDTLMADDDEVVQVWYLCGWAYHLMNDHEAAIEPLQRALEIAQKTGFDDEDMLAHILELLSGSEAGAAGAAAGDDDAMAD